MKILVLNAGSSSQKSCLYEITDRPEIVPNSPLWEAKIDWTGHEGVAELRANKGEETLEKTLAIENPTESRSPAIAQMLKTLWEGKTKAIAHPQEIDAVGHRIVHGGDKYRSPVTIDRDVKGTIAELSSLAPSHNPANLEGIEAIEEILPEIPQVAVFDTAFHAHLPPEAAIYPVPYEWYDRGIRRYGFHGISYQYCSQRAAQLLGKPLEDLRLIACHLGNGCSLAAIAGGRSIDTTMGFTPLEGLMMGTRSGSVDPGLLLYWQQQHDLTPEDVDNMLNRSSGLKGISGVSGDLRELDAAIARGNDRARLALKLYQKSLNAHLGSMLVALGGADAIVFTGGVGEHHPQIREAACEALALIGVKLDPHKNDRSPVDTDIAAPDSRVRVLLVRAREDWEIARECWHELR
jgi:acetate kinase